MLNVGGLGRMYVRAREVPPRRMFFTLAVVALLAGGFLAGFVLLSWKAGSVAGTFHWDAGSKGPFTVGETKDAILVQTQYKTFIPESAGPGCSIGWIDVSQMDSHEHQCLLQAEKWSVELNVPDNPCPTNVDSRTKLEFQEKRLVGIATVCTYPE